LFSYYDVYGNNFANTGTGNINTPGSYLLRRTPKNSACGVEIAHDITAKSPYQAFINSPTAYGIFLVRWAVYNDSSLDSIYNWQTATSIVTITRDPEDQTQPTLQQLERRLISGSDPEKILKLLAVFAPNNPPPIPSELSLVNANLKVAGLFNGTYDQVPGVDFNLANTAALAIITSSLSPNANILTNLGNGWSMLPPSRTGSFGSNYALRAAIAASGYLMLKAPNALYPFWLNTTSSSDDNASSLLGGAQEYLSAAEAVVYTFSRKPPLVEGEFWSLTAYEDNYLIPNERGVYALGDRSNLTYADGKLVYGFSGGDDGQGGGDRDGEF